MHNNMGRIKPEIKLKHRMKIPESVLESYDETLWHVCPLKNSSVQHYHIFDT